MQKSFVRKFLRHSFHSNWRTPRRTICFGFAAALMIAAGQHSSAQITSNWTNPTNGYWHQTGYWSNGVPGAADTANFAQSGSYAVYLSNGTENVGYMKISDGTVQFYRPTSSLYYLNINGSNAFTDLSISGPNTTVSNNRFLMHSLGGAQIVNGATYNLIHGSSLFQGQWIHQVSRSMGT